MKYGKNDIINTLKRRDGLTTEEATEQVESFLELLDDALNIGLGEVNALQEAFQSEFGLEPDYFDALVISELA